ncbi:MAG: DUF3489 domain-containing protein [Pseudomonadota bacterium]
MSLTKAMEIEMTRKTRPAKGRTKPRKTKKAQLIRMLSTKSGADVEVISSKLGWLNHTTRAAITGLKKAGYEVSSEKVSGKPTRYRVVCDPHGASEALPQTVAERHTAPASTNAG